MLQPEIRKTVEDFLRTSKDPDLKWLGEENVGCGSVNAAWRVRTSAGDFFLKCNDAFNLPGLFEAESRGLRRLRDTGTLRVPQVLLQTTAGENAFLLMEFVPARDEGDGFFAGFGRGLARMHRNTWKAFGLDHCNYISSIRQSNAPRGDWAPFFIEERVEPLLKSAIDVDLMPQSSLKLFDQLFRKIPDIIPDEPPALLHGDLWYGNFIRHGDEAVLIDPAIYYGYREVDLAMTKLFGGFHPDFYAAYQEESPLAPGWEDRVDLWNLYPLLVHVMLFGSEYVPQVLKNLEHYR